ncbi:MAG: hypothetical protein JWN94_4933 [Betaproteobacteria bacterium]|nr:hypothetical protein [Betaproteobacteria bacterium]
MDEIVKQGMAKWPNVPAVYGWLSLDRRGNWLIKGERISNPIVSEFIGRNYEHDDKGRWFFQNGPQRVFISLDYTPYVYRLTWEPGALQRMETHTKRMVTEINGAWIDEAGVVLIQSEHGIGLVDDRDLERLLAGFTDVSGGPLSEENIAGAIEQLQSGVAANIAFAHRGNLETISPITAAEIPGRFDFVPRPVQPAGEEECY